MSFVPHGLWKKMASSKSSSQANYSLDSRKLSSPKSIGFDTIKQQKNQKQFKVSDYLLPLQKNSPVIKQQKQRKCSLNYRFQSNMQAMPQNIEGPCNNQFQQKSVDAEQQEIQNSSIVLEQYDFQNTKKKASYFLNVYESFGMDLGITPESKKNKNSLKGKTCVSNKSALQVVLCQLRNLRNYCFEIQILFVKIKQNFENYFSDLKQQFEKKLKQSDQSSKLQSLGAQIEFLQNKNQQIWSKYEFLYQQNELLKKRSQNNKDFQLHKEQQIKLRKANIQLQEKYNIIFQQNQILNRQKYAISKQMNLLSEKVYRLDIQVKQKNDMEKVSRQKNEQTQEKYCEILMRLKQLEEEVKQKETRYHEQHYPSSKGSLQLNAKISLPKMQELYQFTSPIHKFSNPINQPERDKQFTSLRKKATNRATKNNYPNSFIQQRINKRKIQTNRDDSMLNTAKLMRANQSFQNLSIKKRTSSEVQKVFSGQKSMNSFNCNFGLSKILAHNRLYQTKNQVQDSSSKQKMRELHLNIDRLSTSLNEQINKLK